MKKYNIIEIIEIRRIKIKKYWDGSSCWQQSIRNDSRRYGWVWKKIRNDKTKRSWTRSWEARKVENQRRIVLTKIVRNGDEKIRVPKRIRIKQEDERARAWAKRADS